MRTYNIHELDVIELNRLIEKGERFYVEQGDVLPKSQIRREADAFWFPGARGDEQDL